ncbi:formate hydrogenlyase maturation HycH family protein [Thermanaeromonas sp. C210]|uniref:formate hydrogenlyase maturation HycH family protein n=1 Tax=Thermanaeromonas sp. C210 TaxID=2731925 RepID=UPI00155B867E|nr:formate hydrogenlyase maturation HycH family protein [Thermanaeromonas sp. C210]GFN23359.1 formate hydrogenlyase [Thermanaeromonas sp. C210]
MPGKVKFFKLCKRFVDEKDAPPEVKQLEYYALAIGHHIGVVDCLSPVMVMEEEDYFKWISKLPQGKARSKLEGLAKWGELEINRDHVSPLVAALAQASTSFLPEEKKWADCLLQLLQSIKKEPAIYLVVRLSEGASDYSGQRADGR